MRRTDHTARGAELPSSRGTPARIGRGLGLLLLGLSACLFSGRAPTPRELFDSAVDSVVRVDVDQGVGAGFVVDPSGWIVTNLHVIEGTADARVMFRDGRSFPVTRVLGFDEQADLALIAIKGAGLPALELGDSDDLGVGDRIYTIGNPMGFDYTLSDGLVGGLRDIGGVQSLQISASMEPGSSGGPILDEYGRVVGIARGKVTQAGELGLAVPVNQLKALWEEVEDEDTSQRFDEFALDRSRRSARGTRERLIPNHPISILDGCNEEDLRLTFQAIADAIEEGAPLYNQGNTQGCFQVYAETALDLNELLSGDCSGGRDALLDGLERARDLDDFADKAWAMRDSFDGLVDVIGRLIVSLREAQP